MRWSNRFIAFIGAVLFSLLVCGNSAFGQSDDVKRIVWGVDSSWHFFGNGSLTFNQTLLSNWVAGGESTLSFESAAFLGLTYDRKRVNWTNTLDMGYGLQMIGQESRDLRKHLDKIEFNSKFGYAALPVLYYSALFGAKSQFSAGYQYPNKGDKVKISNFVAPLYVDLSIGLDYKPDSHFSLFFSPASGRVTYVRDQDLADQGAFGVKKAVYDEFGNVVTPGLNTRWEIGGRVRMTYMNAFFKNTLGLNAKLELFSNYIEKPENVDVNFDVVLDYELFSWLTARAQLTLIYDDDQKVVLNPEAPAAERMSAAKLQIREMFGIGLAYRF